MRIAVLASSGGTILEALLQSGLPIVVTVVDRRCGAETVSSAAGVPVEVIERSSFGADFDRDGYTAEVVAALGRHEVDVVVMAGYGTVLGEAMHDSFSGRILNTHPALLPAFKGWHGVRDALAAGVKVTGCTVHVATLEVDAGPILAQEAVEVLPDDTEATLHERIKAVERRLYPETVRRFIEAGAADAPAAGGVDEGRREVRALLSVYDKTGLEGLARGLCELGIELVASGKTAKVLEEAGIAHREVAEITGAPEMLGGRVKTLHPVIHAGILADRANPEHLTQLDAAGIGPIDLVVCNLYPFASEPSVEMIDVGGPTMLRAAAKNHDSVCVVVHPEDYGRVLDELRLDGHVSSETRLELARAAFAHTAAYDAAIVRWFDEGRPEALAPGALFAVPEAGSAVDDASTQLPKTIHLALERAEVLRYGENPHQAGARYRPLGSAGGWPEHLVQHSGVPLSYLNYFDADAAWRLAHELTEIDGASPIAAVIVKHANPCGAAVAGDIATAYLRAVESDPMSAFGGIVALTAAVDLPLAEILLANPLADVIIATDFDEEAVALLAGKRKRTRLLSAPRPGPAEINLRQIDGGFLVQSQDRFIADRSSWRVVTKVAPSEDEWRDIELVWRVCARTSSNAIVVGRGGQILGVGCGQQNRVEAAAIAVRKADGRARGGAAASDAFFPFRDGLDAVAASGVATIIQPGGSLRDDEVIAAADEHEMAMVITGERHFRH